ncbi:flagellar hook-associated protein FlgK [Parablautia muri]|uniref:Flagellar hook-associated protein 1 n=1 Tax=Parablautia muri TaxID=2320879 RepID=A0A9X5GT33_9FIRM|nr:flagellar hook-associated protein FlgK [Parablautia muri]NBJ92562.1 flagellar hook-associated protein FlgK [Parablautia muri]
MPSQFLGLYIAGSGLRASNASLNTTANNIANAQTVGYSRQQATTQASEALRVHTTYGCVGTGVNTIAIERIRDSFYDVKYWENNCKYGEYSVKQYYMQMIEDYFDDDNTSGFRSIFNKFSASLQSITTNASSDESKAQFIASAKALTDYFNNMYGNLQELQKDINLEIKQCVDEINALAEKIANLNRQINMIELSGPKANELRDQRELLVDQLSELVDVEVRETPLYDASKGETGANRYMVCIAGGQPLVDGVSFKNLKYEARDENEKVNQTDADGLYDIKWENGNAFRLTNSAMEGRLKGLVELRDGNNSSNFTGTIPTGGINGGAGSGNPLTVDVVVSADYLKKMQECMLSDTGGVIHIGNTACYYSKWEFDPDTNTYTFTIDEDKSPKIGKEKEGKEAKTEVPIKYQGIPYYMEQMNAWIRGFADKVNEIFTKGYDVNGNQGDILFTGSIETGGTYTQDDFSGIKGYYELTAGNFTINPALILDSSLLGTRSSKEVGVEECGQIEEVIALLASKEKFNFRNGTAGQMLERILSDVALNASDANTFCDTYAALRNSIDNQRSSISSVDEDEEAVNLVKFQNAYTLASKMVQTLTEIYDQLILRTGV